MKTIKIFYLFYFIFALLSSKIFSQEDLPGNWSYISINTPLDVQFINQMTGFVAVRNGTNIDIKKTTNYGANWASLIANPSIYCGYDIKSARLGESPRFSGDSRENNY